jgi:predicted dienelactone hydrolase
LIASSCAVQHASELPAPTGPYRIGSMRLSFTDSLRPETFTPDPGDHREVALRIWFPARESSCHQRVPYLEQAAERRRALPAGSPLPAAFFDRLSTWESHSFSDAVPATDVAAFPVILYSHATGAGIDASTVLMEDLASHGYVAVSIGHAFETSHFIRADGTVRTFGFDNEELRARALERGAGVGLQRKLNETRDPDALAAIVRQIVASRPKAMESLRIWVEDIRFAIDRLEKMNRNGMFEGRLDLDRIGVMGHSFGGAAAGQACLDDDRCRAGVNLDGLQLGTMLDRPLERPFLFLHHDNAGSANSLINLPFFESARDTCYTGLARGTRHLNFSDVGLPAFARAADIPEGVLGPIDGIRALTILDDVVRQFFDRHLCGRPAPLLDDPSAAYPELELRMRAPSR